MNQIFRVVVCVVVASVSLSLGAGCVVRARPAVVVAPRPVVVAQPVVVARPAGVVYVR